MKTCTKCGHANKDEAKYCGACGNKFEAAAPAPAAEPTPAETICPACGSKNRPGVHFCGYCGADLSKVAQGGIPASSPQVALESGAELTSEPAPPLGAAEQLVQAVSASAAEPAPSGVAEVPDTSAPLAPEPVAEMAQAASEPEPAATCGHCGAVIRYCPCCGEPLVDPQTPAS